MNIQHNDLIRLGWNEWFEERSESDSQNILARVVAVDRNSVLVMDHTGVSRAKLSGSYLYQHRLLQELPCVGDWVGVEKHDGEEMGLIQTLLERKTVLRRKAAGETSDYQLIAANMDYVMIVQSCRGDFNLKRLERYLVMAQEGGADACILLAKTDLVTPDVLAAQVAEIKAAGISAPVYTLSNITLEGVEEFNQTLLPTKTYCFVGSSGVGKSTIINQLLGHEMLLTGDLSETGEGMHTTVRRELIILQQGALVIDNPGTREFGISGSKNALQDSFTDITTLAASCRYSDCSHTNEPVCAVREAVKAGTITQERYDNFIKLSKESKFNQLSYAEKRKKDRDFGKFIKNAKTKLKK
jgi:ribosome biogenesis GTPase / thiamine phosphate phosphatase